MVGGALLNGQPEITAMTENEIAREIVDAAYKIHRKLGPGLLESVYEIILAHELRVDKGVRNRFLADFSG